MSIEKNNAMIQSLQVGMSIVDLLSSKEQPLKFSEIQELTQITKSNLIQIFKHFDASSTSASG